MSAEYYFRSIIRISQLCYFKETVDGISQLKGQGCLLKSSFRVSFFCKCTKLTMLVLNANIGDGKTKKYFQTRIADASSLIYTAGNFLPAETKFGPR